MRIWEDERRVTRCYKCQTSFGLTVWKHHCRACGKVFCDECSLYYMKIPPDEICPDTPANVIVTNPQRCCRECAERIRARQYEENRLVVQHFENNVRSPIAPSPGRNPVCTVNALEFDRSKPSKLYAIRLPADRPVLSNQAIRVDLGGHINHVYVPRNVRPGDIVHVRANIVNIVVPDNNAYVDIVTEVYIVDVRTLDEILNPGLTNNNTRLSGGTYAAITATTQQAQSTHPSSSSQQQEETTENQEAAEEEGAFIECAQCTFHNSLRVLRCRMCDSRLYDESEHASPSGP